MTKAERTKQHIIETVSPIFNKLGYIGTSMSDITKATGLTKGSVYGNFENKEDLAIQAFRYNVTKVLEWIGSKLETEESAIGKLKALTSFYRTYYDKVYDMGGCPILNVGVDSTNQNALLLERVERIIIKIQGYIESMIDAGIKEHSIDPTVNSNKYAKKIFAMIEGSIFMAFTTKDKDYLIQMMDHIDALIETELKI